MRASTVLIAGAVAAALGYGGWHAYDESRAEIAGGESAGAALPAKPARVVALGHLEPRDGLRHIAGPSKPSVVIGKMLVEETDSVKAGQVIAVLDDVPVLKSELERLRAMLDNTKKECSREEKLYRQHAISKSELDSSETKLEVAEADVHKVEAELEMSTVRSPIDGRVVKIHARTGERVGADGIADIGETGKMYAVAEVYETDVRRLRVGQRAEIDSPAFAAPVHGTVERIGLAVAKQDILDTDPAARTDARVVEVWVRLDQGDGQKVAGLTNLEAEVTFVP